MTMLVAPLAMANAGKIGVAAGILVFAILFIKLIMGFIRFCFRHPIIFILLLVCGGLGLAFNVLLAGILILAVFIGGGLAMFLGNFN